MEYERKTFIRYDDVLSFIMRREGMYTSSLLVLYCTTSSTLTPVPSLVRSCSMWILTTIEIGLFNGDLEASLNRGENEREDKESHSARDFRIAFVKTY